VEPTAEPVDFDDVPQLNALEPHRIKGTQRVRPLPWRLDVRATRW
jgi:hypothetical protein